jgi:DNA-binding transcriptional LysR family regulator
VALKFDLADLQAFRRVCELGSFRAAAQALHLSQPALSRRIEKLEEALEIKLLDRTTRRVNLTAIGRDFLRKSQNLLDDLDDMLLGVKDVAATKLGEVKVACVHSVALYFLPPILARFAKQYPRIKVKVLDSGANEVLNNVAQGHADFGINLMGQHEENINFQPLLQERFVLACLRGHPLASRQSVRWEELGDYHLIGLDKSSGNRLMMDLALAKLPKRPVTFFEALHVQSVLGMVEAGIGVAAVPQLAMPGSAHRHLMAIPLVDPVVQRELGLLTKQGRSLAPAAQALFNLLLTTPAQARVRAAAN